MNILLLRFDAPLMSFGAPIVDNRGEIQPYPALSMMTGLLGNALGFDHAETEALERLQHRLLYAVRQDRAGEQIQDYQTVDLSKPYMDDARAWTTRGELETRKGGSASSGTHIRQRDYWADAAYTVALTLNPAGQTPTLDDIAGAVRKPERPLFIGRKPCLPASFLFLKQTEAPRLVDALSNLDKAPLAPEPDDRSSLRAWWPIHPDDDKPAESDPIQENMRKPVTDQRDWENQIHAGQRWIAYGPLSISESSTS
ncbi:type I-E CRISPR-associated protein Cas5/CasD [Salinibacter altiplanensis]|uniref:type I-E CRISPR-associated protein Cas5/CasD n=1 Tax=Salinibacter altiplanensis TaxID=1803181 RepID=UPI000C9FF94B|nr:type I-E CRISPR-associated protein Cas5/CasD [Salinibacter altiplanensis]